MQLTVEPTIKPYFKQIDVGDKSITHRALIMGALSVGETVILNPCICKDTYSTLNCLRTLGANFAVEQTRITVTPIQKVTDKVVLDCGNSGTTARLLSGIVAGLGINATFAGDKSLSNRPQGQLKYLQEMGAKVVLEDNCLFKVLPSALSGAIFTLTQPSAQVKSAILLAGLFASGKTVVTESVQTRDHTERILKLFGANFTQKDLTNTVTPGVTCAQTLYVPNDISAFSYYISLAVVKGEIYLNKILINPTRMGFVNILRQSGAKITLLNRNDTNFEPYADMLIEKSTLSAINVSGYNLSTYVDELPLLALLCAVNKQSITFYGLSPLRGKETNRVQTTAQMLTNLGCVTSFDTDTLTISAPNSIVGGGVCTYGDHRIAMTSVIAGKISAKGVVIDDVDCIDISCPDFLSMLEA